MMAASDVLCSVEGCAKVGQISIVTSWADRWRYDPQANSHAASLIQPIQFWRENGQINPVAWRGYCTSLPLGKTNQLGALRVKVAKNVMKMLILIRNQIICFTERLLCTNDIRD